MTEASVLTSTPDVLGGARVFAGTRVPVQNLIDYLKAGDSVDDFIEEFPTVSRSQVLRALELAQDFLTAGAGSS